MKKLIILLCLVAPLLGRAQNFDSLKREGYKLKDLKKDKEAAAIFDRCIDLVIAGKKTVTDVEWFILLDDAISVNKLNSFRYSRLAYGSRAEKLADKVAFLKDMGVKNMIAFKHYGWHTGIVYTSPYYCPDGEEKTLVWAAADGVYLQGFSNCHTFKPVKIDDKTLADLLKNHTEELVKEKIEPINYYSETEIYEYEFYLNDRSYKTPRIDEECFVDIKTNKSADTKYIKPERLNALHDAYVANMKTHFARLFTQLRIDEGKYRTIINSGAERALAGKLE